MKQAETVTGGSIWAKINVSQIGLPAVFIGLVAVNLIITPNFIAFGTLNNLIIQSFPIILIGLGMTAIISTGGIDISVGAVMALSSVVMANLYINYGASLPMGLLAGIGAAALVGAFNGFCISYFKIDPTIMTLIMMIMIRGFAEIITNGFVMTLMGYPVVDAVKSRLGGFPLQLYFSIVAVIVFWFIFKRHILGKQVQAVGDNYKASLLAGISPMKSLMFVYIITAVFAGLAGMIEASRSLQADATTIGKLKEMSVIAAVTVGGTPMTGGKAKIAGTVVGALLITLITMTVNMNNIPFYYAYIIQGIIIVVALYFNMKSEGKESRLRR